MPAQTHTAVTPRISMFEVRFLQPALVESFKRLAPQYQWRNPVMFVCYIGAIFTTGLGIQAIAGDGEASVGYILNVSLWLWFTVLFANFAEALAESRSKAQAAHLRAAKRDVQATKLRSPKHSVQVRSTNHLDRTHSSATFPEALPAYSSVMLRSRMILLQRAASTRIQSANASGAPATIS